MRALAIAASVWVVLWPVLLGLHFEGVIPQVSAWLWLPGLVAWLSAGVTAPLLWVAAFEARP